MESLSLQRLQAEIRRSKRILHLISLLLFIITIPFGVLWYLNPTGNYEPPIVVLLSLAAVAGGAPTAAELFGPKPVRDLGYEEIVELIIKSDHTRDWETAHRGDREVTFYKQDPNLRFEFLHTDEGIQCRDFQEPWANNFPDQSATGYFHDLYYGNTLLKRFILVAVDGGRSLLPLPRSRYDLTISKINYTVAKIHNVLGTLDEYMNRAGMRIE